ncbi:MAG: hypothetical protein IJD38_03100, partial [Clostridia bacterium]|nr:hypothetical protein [Clostridia bacterium]
TLSCRNYTAILHCVFNMHVCYIWTEELPRFQGVLSALDFMEATADPNFQPVDPVEFSPEQLANIRAATHDYLDRAAKELGEMKWYEHNLVTLRAKAALRDAGYEG